MKVGNVRCSSIISNTANYKRRLTLKLKKKKSCRYLRRYRSWAAVWVAEHLSVNPCLVSVEGSKRPL